MVIVELDGEELRGRAIDLRDREVEPEAIAAAIRSDDAQVTVHCPEPGPVHRRVGLVREGRSYPIRAALAATARALGYRAPQDGKLADVREELASLDPPEASTTEERKRLAAAGGDVDRMIERVAALRGKIEAARERGEPHDDLTDAYREAVAELSERRTERIAAEQALRRARADARRARDRRERRLRLQDRERNLERAARRELAAAIEPTFERALAAVPGECEIADRPGTVQGDETTAALAVCRIAPLSAPIVVGCDRFPTAAAAAAALDGPVILA